MGALGSSCAELAKNSSPDTWLRHVKSGGPTARASIASRCPAGQAPPRHPHCLSSVPVAMTLQLAAFPRPPAIASRFGRTSAAAQARARPLVRPPLRAAAARRPRPPAAAPDDPRHFGEPEQQEQQEEESSDDEEFDTIAGAVEVVDEAEAEVGAACHGIPRRRLVHLRLSACCSCCCCC